MRAPLGTFGVDRSVLQDKKRSKSFFLDLKFLERNTFQKSEPDAHRKLAEMVTYPNVTQMHFTLLPLNLSVTFLAY